MTSKPILTGNGLWIPGNYAKLECSGGICSHLCSFRGLYVQMAKCYGLKGCHECFTHAGFWGLCLSALDKIIDTQTLHIIYNKTHMYACMHM